MLSFRSLWIGLCAALMIASLTGCTASEPRGAALDETAISDQGLSISRHSDEITVKYIQNLSARDSLSLDGEWARIIDPYENGFYNYRYQEYDNGYFRNKAMQTPSDLIEYNFATAPKLTVPGDWNSQEPELLYYEGTVWYQKDFTLERAEKSKYILEFGAVNYKAVVYVNGVKVGSHEGGFTSFQFDVTDHVKDGDNFVVVKADNRRERDQIPTVNTDWWNYGGLTRSVTLTALPQSHIQDYNLLVRPESFDAITGHIQITNPDKAVTSARVSIAELGIDQRVDIDEAGFGAFSIAAKPKLWSPDSPKLYSVDIAYGDDALSDKIGFRTISVDGTNILLNGEPVFMRGISIHEETLLHAGRAWSEDDARSTLTLAKELGTNFVRLAHYPHNENMVKMADELGLMVWSEIPVYWTVLFDDPHVYAKAQAQLTEMILRDHNRASIVMWSVANETPLSDARLEFLSALIDKTRALDPTRLVTAAIDTHDISNNTILLEDPLAERLDVIGINSYCGWYWSETTQCSKKLWDSAYNKPIIMSEMGAGAKQGKFGADNEIWTEEFQANVYRHNLEMASNISGLRGISPWILKDFRSPRRPLDIIQEGWNRKGLVSETGEKKQAWYILQEFYAQITAQNSPAKE